MPRPQPLAQFSSAVPNSDEGIALVTPRTPHSRTARMEGGFAKLQVSDGVEWDDQRTLQQQQSAPLLHSSTSARFSAAPRSSKKESRTREKLSPWSRTVLVLGVCLAGILLLLIILSWTRPQILHQYIGIQYFAPDSPDTSTEKSSQSRPQQNQSPAKPPPIPSAPKEAPAEPLSYFNECLNLMGQFKSHGRYWDATPHDDDSHHDHPQGDRVCSNTITYMLDGRVGLAADLALMAQVAALARERNRTFLVDDTYWNRGKWTDFFQDVRGTQKGPEPGCLPPPPHELRACPRTSRHWVVNSITAKFHLGHPFADNYEDPFGHELTRLKPIFNFARESLTQTIVPNVSMQKLINIAKQEVAKKAGLDKNAKTKAQYLAVHIRRGDRLPTGYLHHRQHIPTQRYAGFISRTWNRLRKQDANAPANPILYIATDSPVAANEIASLHEGPSFTLSHSEEMTLREIASEEDYYQKHFNEYPADTRHLLTKGAIVDLAMTTGLWDKNKFSQVSLEFTVCTVSSNFCRLAAVGMGWEKAFGKVNDLGEIDKEHMRWVDVDIQGLEIPPWTALELF